MNRAFFAIVALAFTQAVSSSASADSPILVTPDNFNRAETDMNFAGGGGRQVGRFLQHREPIPG